MSLLRLQRDLRVWLHHGEEAQAERFAPSARAGLAVYQNNFRGQIVECLGDSFPVTRAWIGEDDFQAAIVEHVRRVPPSSWTLDATPPTSPQRSPASIPAIPKSANWRGSNGCWPRPSSQAMPIRSRPKCWPRSIGTPPC